MCILSSAHEPTLLCPAHSSVCFHIQFWTGADENAEPSAFLYPCVFELSVKDGGGHTRVTRGGGGKENQQRLGKPLGQLELLLPAGPQGWGGEGWSQGPGDGPASHGGSARDGARRSHGLSDYSFLTGAFQRPAQSKARGRGSSPRPL